MITFVTSLCILILGYALYGLFVERVFGADPKRKTPCYTMADGVDYVPMPTWKVYLIQFLNIAGTGPIFGAIQGILFGPAAFLWIVLGCVFGGAVHDYLSGMISLRKGGVSQPILVGQEMGQRMHYFVMVFVLVLLVMVGAVFVTTPAGLLANLTGGLGEWSTPLFWSVIIFLYYMMATVLPIDKLIGRIYPVFGLALLIMAVGLLWGIFAKEGSVPEITGAFTNHHPDSPIPLFPGICITIACGAVSGFHATQSPMMVRCVKNEKLCRPVFYGSMITEGVVALIWAAAAIKYADSLQVPGDTPYEKLLAAMTVDGQINPAIIVNDICNSWMGSVGAVLAMLGVIVAPITTGDTALRSARLIAYDFFRIKDTGIVKRLLVSLPIFVAVVLFMMIRFDILWRYFAWGNQTLSIFTLWAVTIWMARHGKLFIVSLVPTVWMMLTCISYILVAKEGLDLSPLVSNVTACAVTVASLVLFFRWYYRNKAKGFRVDQEA